MSKKGENIRKRKDGRYEGRFADGYKADGTVYYRSVYGKTYTETKQKVRLALSGALAAPNQSKLSFSEVTAMWLLLKKQTIKASTYAKYTGIINGYLLPNFGKQRIGQLTCNQIEKFAIELLGTLNTKTVKGILIVLNQILQFSAAKGYCKQLVLNIKLPKDKKDKLIIFTQAQQRRLTEYLSENMDLQKFGILLCLYTGLRLGEICGLRWEDIDLESRLIKVRRTIQRIPDEDGNSVFLIGSPKTECSVRDIPIPDFLVQTIAQYKNKPTCYILTGTRKFTQPRTYQNHFKKYLRESGLPDFNFHILRHTFASRAIELGFDAKSLSEILGHSGVNITLNLYVHSSVELKRKQMQLFSNII